MTSRRTPTKLDRFDLYPRAGGALAARFGTEFTWVRLSTNFPSKQIWRRMQTLKDDEFLLGFKFYGVRKGFWKKVFMNSAFNGIFGHQEAWCMNSSWVTTSKLGEFSSDQPGPSLYIFPPTVVLKTLFLILNICCELTILVRVLQQSLGNVH